MDLGNNFLLNKGFSAKIIAWPIRAIRTTDLTGENWWRRD
jgi:hypothetical protein